MLYLLTLRIFTARILGQVLPLPAAPDVYASFSHVNLLFSRHSLHFLSRLLRGDVPSKQFQWPEGLLGNAKGEGSSLEPVELKLGAPEFTRDRLLR